MKQVSYEVPASITYQPISRHQALTRDLALVVDQDVSAQDIMDTIRAEVCPVSQFS